jgi:B12-binding domain/radical SAM domain protein
MESRPEGFSLLELAFVANKHNLNSIAALTGALEADPRTSELRLHFVWDDERALARLRGLALGTKRLVVALSFATAQMQHAASLMQALAAERGPAWRVVAGGPHASAEPEWVLHRGANAVVIGEGEASLPALLEKWYHNESVAGLAGTATLGPAGEVTRGLRTRPIDLDDYPPFGVQHRRFGPVEITRGCASGCAFCQTTFLFGGRPRHRSVDQVVHWVEAAMAHGYDYVRFVTPNAFAYATEPGESPNLEALDALLCHMNRLVGRKRLFFGTFPSEVSPESVTPEAVALVRRYCGNRHLLFGAQSGSPRILQTLRRGHTVADIHRAARIILEGGMTPIIDLIFGLPDETPEDLKATVHLMTTLAEMGAVIHAHTFMPLPGTPLAGAPPGQVDPQLHRLLDRLASEGQLWGQWRRQQEIAAL